MYGLPRDFDSSRFIGQSVELVSFSANTVHVVFDGGCSITLEGPFEHRLGHEGEDGTRAVVPVASSDLMSLIGRSVTAGDVERPGTLSLRFEDGQVLRCLDDSAEYESYRIICDGREIIV